MLVGGAIAGVGAELNARAYVVSYVYCENVTELPQAGSQAGDAGDYTGCMAANITFPESVSGFWDIWMRSKHTVVESLFVW